MDQVSGRLGIENRRNRAFDFAIMSMPPGDFLLTWALRQIGRAGNSVYRVTWGWLIEKAMARLNIDHARYTFIDYSSGKGKAMLMASDHPFRSIIGVEYAPRLQAIAAANRLSYAGPGRCHSLQPLLASVRLHAAAWPIVFFMCNPFDVPVPCVWSSRPGTHVSKAGSGHPHPLSQYA